MFHLPNPIFLPQMGSKVFVYLLTDLQLSLDFARAEGMQSSLRLPEDDKLGTPVLHLWAGLGTWTLFWGTAEWTVSEVKFKAQALCVAVGFWCCSCD